jgi:hypothetical protein
MILPVLKYGHPALRQRGSRIEKITPEIARLIGDMFETMYAARGVGLAAQQVGHAVQLTVIDVSEITDRPSTLHLEGKPADEGPPLDTDPNPGLSRVDLSVSIPLEYTPQSEPDDYRCFVIDWPETTVKYVSGFEGVPGGRRPRMPRADSAVAAGALFCGG